MGRTKIVKWYSSSWNRWPYVERGGYPSAAERAYYGYPAVHETRAYYVLGFPPQPKKVTHLLHGILTVLTGGFWLPVWLVITVITHTRNTRVDADYWARIQRYRQWELAQQSVNVPLPRELPRGG